MTCKQRYIRSVSVAALTLMTAPAFAGAPGHDVNFHDDDSTDIIVTAPIHRDRMDVLANSVAISGQALTNAIRPTIGETLQHTAGVSATSFGPNASRPVLRGLQGERAKVLTDGIGSIDVSNTSVDHAVVINPLLADRIEVVRGPEALLYDAAPLGGVVNVSDKRIPRARPEEVIHVDAIGSYGSASRERSGGGAIDAPVGENFVVHVDGSYLKTDDLRVGGYVLSPRARAAAASAALLPPEPDAEEPIDFAGNASLKRRLPNSTSKTWTLGAGAAYIGETGNIGFSYGHYDSLYGVPIRYATAPGEEQEAPRLDVVQDRIDARAEIETGGGFLQSINLRAGYAHYRHYELEEDGVIGTAFYNDGYEARLELVQTDRGVWHGASGAQFTARDFNVIGDEAFLPRSSTQKIGAFTVQQLDYGALKVEGGLRYEHSDVSASPLESQPQFFRGGRSFDTLSGSLGASYGLSDNWRVGANLMRTQRAPSADELFANGPHAGTEAFEIGDPGFRTERAWGVEAVLHGRGDGFSINASIYHNWFDNFIYDARTPTLEDGLPVFQYFQARARYYGAEAEASVRLARIGDYEIKADVLGDYTRATISGAGPSPRIPPLRVLGGVEAEGPMIGGRIEVEWTDRARRLATFETPTGGFTLVNASLTLRPLIDHPATSIVLSANNIFDVDARRHASYLKDFAPLAGRDIRVTARFNL